MPMNSGLKLFKDISPFAMLRILIIYQNLPWPFNILAQLLEDPGKYKLRKSILKFADKDDIELRAVKDYLKHNPLRMIPQSYINLYNIKDVKVYHENGEKFVLFQQKRVYFPRTWSDIRIMKYFNWMQIETDNRSPHKYESEAVFVKDGDVVADIGTAEGFFALSVIDKVNKVYLFECCEEWIGALKKTFEPFGEKVFFSTPKSKCRT
jgi:hypothetical protein